MWNKITNQDDWEKLLSLFGGFHDSCIKEFKYISGAYVDENLSMYPINSERIIKIIFQRQFNNPSVIEMEFIGLLQLSMLPLADNFTCEILDVTMIFDDGSIYWLDCGGLTKNDINDYTGTLICSSAVRWRVADEYIGQEEVYVRKKS